MPNNAIKRMVFKLHFLPFRFDPFYGEKTTTYRGVIQQGICTVGVITKKISKKSLFKLLLADFTTELTAFSLLCGIAARFGAETIQWNEVYRTGIEGLVYSIFMGPVLGVVFACLIWLFLAPGLWINSFF